MRKDDFVSHKTFGIGIVKSVGAQQLIVDFDGVEKKFLCRDANKYLTPAVHNHMDIVDGVLKRYIGNTKSVEIPGNVKRIGDKAFAGNKYIYYVESRGTVIEIGESAFEGCVNLKSVNGLTNLRKIGSRAFQKCTSLVSIRLPDSLAEIEGAAFNECTALTDIKIPNKVRTIPFEAFQGCRSLVTVLGMNGVKTIMNDAFLGCYNLKVRIPNGVTKIEKRAFYYCDGNEIIDIPDSVISIGSEAFAGVKQKSIRGTKGSYIEKYAKVSKLKFISNQSEPEVIKVEPTNPVEAPKGKIRMQAKAVEPPKIEPVVPVVNVVPEQATFQPVAPVPVKPATVDPVVITEPRVAFYPPEERRKHSNFKRNAIVAALMAVAVGVTSIVAMNFDRVSNMGQMLINNEINTGTGTYTGDLNMGVIEGNGTMKFKSGDSYVGEWREGLMSGAGALTFLNQDQYAGDMFYGERSGEGTYQWADGSTYVGEWDNDLPNGEGTLTFADGGEFVGTFEDGRIVEGDYKKEIDGIITGWQIAYGEGVFFGMELSDGTVIGTEDVEDFVEFGIAFANGDEYYGEMSDGMKNGFGSFVWQSGDIYSGDWVADQMNGTGVYTYADGTELLGEFEDNQFVNGTVTIEEVDGIFEYNIVDGVLSNEIKVTCYGDVYTGTFTGNKLSGTGVIAFDDGDKYEGSIVDGKMSGQGTYTWSDDKYVGGWSDSKMNGSGTYYFSGSQTHRLVGKFKDNEPNGTCYYYTSEGTRYVTTWSQGSMTNIYKG